MSEPALLATADGELFRGRSVGAEGLATGEAVFNTSMAGYQEILTDPSYAGQVVVMTVPHVGNYGINASDGQSSRPHVSAFVMRSMSRRDSNWQSEGSISSYLMVNQVVAVADVDTRRLTRHIRDRGAMPIAVGAGATEREIREAAEEAPRMEGRDLASSVTPEAGYSIEADGDARGRVVAIDLGMKRDIGTSLASKGFTVDVVPLSTPSDEILEMRPDGVFISNGPGDPEPLTDTIQTLRSLIGKVPIFGICLGHQVLGLALGASTYKLPFGHHGGNHPVRRMIDGRVEITAQNHGFAVDLWSLSDRTAPQREGLVTPELLPGRVESEFGTVVPTHQNLNDGTLEGMRLLDARLFTVQYHPEAAPGPSDSAYLFDEFVTLVEAAR